MKTNELKALKDLSKKITDIRIDFEEEFSADGLHEDLDDIYCAIVKLDDLIEIKTDLHGIVV